MDNDEKLFRKATGLLLASKFEEVTKLCQENDHDENIRLGVFETFLALMGALSSFGEKELANALDLAWKHEARASTINKNGKTPHEKIRAELVRADTHLFGAIVQLLQESYLKAFWNLRNSWKYYDHARTEIGKLPSSVDSMDESKWKCIVAELEAWSYFGVGTFNLLMSMLPPAIVRVAEVIGFGADRQFGIALLRNSIKSSRLTKLEPSEHEEEKRDAEQRFLDGPITSIAPYSWIIYLVYLVTTTAFLGTQTEQHLDEATKLLDAIDTLFPNAGIMLFHRSRLFRSQRRLEESLQANIEAGRSLVVIMPSLSVIVDYNSAFACLFLQRWRRSASYFAKLLGRGSSASGQVSSMQGPEEFSNDELLAVARPPASGSLSRASSQMMYCYLIALCMSMLGEWDVALAFYAAVPQWALKRDKPRPVELYAQVCAQRAAQECAKWRTFAPTENIWSAPGAVLDAVEVSMLWNGFAQVCDF